MALSAGTRIGIYQVVSAIGAGGMGGVYRARDTQLDRDVALKILPDAVANDPERVMRFTREAKTLASLNHPNIAAIYGIEANALVMELADGEDLAAHIARGPIPAAEALASVQTAGSRAARLVLPALTSPRTVQQYASMSPATVDNRAARWCDAVR